MSNSSVPLLSAHSITKSFGPRTARHQVLFDVSADVHAGECLAVIGGSGSGKSTLTRIMLGLESADSGSVEYESQSIVGGRKSPGLRPCAANRDWCSRTRSPRSTHVGESPNQWLNR